MIEIILYVAVSVLSLFLLFVLTKNDFVLIRKGITQTQMFDIYFSSVLFAIILGRVFYIFDSSKYEYIHLIKFFYVTRLPGLSILGVFLGAIFAIFLLYRGKSAFKRIMDIFLLVGFPVTAVYLIFHGYGTIYFLNYVGALFALLGWAYLFRAHHKYTLKDGSIFLLLLSVVGLVQASSLVLIEKTQLFLGLSFSQIASALLITVCLILLVLNQLYARK